MATKTNNRVNLKKFLAKKSDCACEPWKGSILFDEEYHCAVATEGHAMIISFQDYDKKPENPTQFLQLKMTEHTFVCNYVYDKFWEDNSYYPAYRYIIPDEEMLVETTLNTADIIDALQEHTEQRIAEGFETKYEIEHSSIRIGRSTYSFVNLRKLALLPSDGIIYTENRDNGFLVYKNNDYIALFAATIPNGNEPSIYELLKYEAV